MPIRAVPNEVDFAALERDVLDRWARERTFEQSVQFREGCREYVFYDGPPFATGLPHYGHILTSYIKDVVPRYFTMRGYHVARRWGWDCHGLPVEFEVEKEHGFKSRTDILEFGIDRFNASCRQMVLRYASEWRRIISRLGRWVDFDNDYKTMDPDYTESVVWVFKDLWDRGLVYEGQKVVAYCTRCQTSLSNFEARQDDAFRSRVDPAVTVRFRLKNEPSQSLVAWTTTPWTLPSNVAVAVRPDIEYTRVTKDGESVWISTACLPRYARELAGYDEAERRLGSDLVGVEYEPLFPYFASTLGAFRVLPAEFVSTEEGTGFVHLAPSFGEDDAAVCAEFGIEGPNPVRDDGTFDATVPDLAGLHVLEANDQIAARLKSDGTLFTREQYTHKYPHCWRCDSPLLYRAITTWFIRVTDVKSDMMALNRNIRWIPEHVRDGRFGKWLENARDWAVSRSRFWGAPVPVWRCDRCATDEVIGSRQELEQKSGAIVTDWHRPAIDQLTWRCPCGGMVARVPDVLDCWFESGAMPYAQVHYPFEHKEEFEASFPGDFIVEYLAQTRGWFYTLVVEAAALFRERPFKSVICHGVILAEDGRKMSKRLKNYPDPMELVETHGSDALRIALLNSALVRGADMRFSPASVRDAVRRVCIPVWNCLHYYTTYAAIDQFEPIGRTATSNMLDRYLLSETDRLRQDLEDLMAEYDVAGCYEAIEAYVVMLSTWYVRLSKRRFWESGMSKSKREAFETLHAALSSFARLSAPFTPFLSESIHEALGGTRSVHLEDWPASRHDWRDHELSNEMRTVRKIVHLAGNVREVHHISRRQPLLSVAVANVSPETISCNLDLLRDELNVKQVTVLSSLDRYARPVIKLNYQRLGKILRGGVKELQAEIDAGRYELVGGGSGLRIGDRILDQEDFSLHYAAIGSGKGVAADGRLLVLVDLTIDPVLLEEKQMRDLNRGVQDLRKKAGLRYDERIRVGIVAPEPLANVLAAHLAWLRDETLAVEIVLGDLASPEERGMVDVGDETVEVLLRRA
jgi:isoleucyl-tRNA synthetase